jgi:hypothetical protein
MLLTLYMFVQVSAAQQQLEGLSFTVSAARVAGAFMCDFSTVQQQLLLLEGDIAAVWQDPCHLGVLATLQAAHQQQQRMSAAVKVGPIGSTAVSSCMQLHLVISKKSGNKLELALQQAVYCPPGAQVCFRPLVVSRLAASTLEPWPAAA